MSPAAVNNGSGEEFETSEKCAGYALLDPLGQRIGRVEKLFESKSGKPRYVRVKVGAFGARRSVLIPVRDVLVVDRGRRVLALR